jgi:hypothetical protein
VVSTTIPPKRGCAGLGVSDDGSLEAVLARFWPGGTLPLTDHDTFRLGGDRPRRYAVWQIARRRWHLVEWTENPGAAPHG